MPPRTNAFGPPPLHGGPTFPHHPGAAVAGMGGLGNQIPHMQTYYDRERLQAAQQQQAQIQHALQQQQVTLQQQAAAAAQAHHVQQQQLKHSLQQHQQSQQMPNINNIPVGVNNQAAPQVARNGSPIRNVYRHNLEHEMAILRDLVDKYNYIAMDTEFPGIVARPMGEFKSKSDYHYQTLRCNVDVLKIIQLGITLLDEDGNPPPGEYCTWQFNFKFSLAEDMYAQESIELLTKSGIDFNRAAEQGIDVEDFGTLLITSGLVLLDNVKWISFHSGYDFGYLVKIMLATQLPHEESEFAKYLAIFFPALYDIKYLMKYCKRLKGGLQDIADELGIKRIGPQHQAGSDSLLTGKIFFEMRRQFFNDKIEDDKMLGQVWGLNGVGMQNSNGINTNGAVVYNNGRPTTPATSSGNNPKSSTPGPSQQQTQPGIGATPGGSRDPGSAFQYGRMGGA